MRVRFVYKALIARRHMNLNIEAFLTKGLDEAIKAEGERIFARKMQEAVEQFERAKNEIITAYVLEVMNQVQIETMRDSIVLTVRKQP
jgi:hypothetical protein